MKKLLIILLALFLFTNLYAKDEENKKTEAVESVEAIEVKGESRKFNMKLILRTKKDKISFVKTRKNYRKEILSTEP